MLCVIMGDPNNAGLYDRLNAFSHLNTVEEVDQAVELLRQANPPVGLNLNEAEERKREITSGNGE